MQVEIKEISNCKRELYATVESNRAKEDYQKILMKYRKSIVVHGFRKGKAPLFMIDNIYGKQALEEYYDEYLPKYFDEIIKDKNITPAARGSVKKVEWDKKSDMNITFSYDIDPEFELTDYKGIELAVKLHEFNEEQVNFALRKIQEQFANVREKEGPAEENNLVVCNITVIDKNGKKIMLYNDKTYKIGSNKFGKQFDKDLIGVKKFDKIKTVIEYFDKDIIEKFSDIVDLNEPKNVIVDVNEVEIEELPDLDDELAKDTGEYETIDEMKHAIRKDIQNDIENLNSKIKEDAWFNYVIEKNNFEVPESKVEQLAIRNLMNLVDIKHLDKSLLEKYLERMRKPIIEKLKRDYIIEKLTELETAEVTDEEIENKIIREAEEHQMDLEKFKKVYKKQLKRDVIEKLLKQEKILKNVINSCKIVEPKEEINTDKANQQEE